MSNFNLPFWAQEQIAEIEAQVGRKISEADLACLDINSAGHTMTVARDPLLSEVRKVETEKNRELGANPELR